MYYSRIFIALCSIAPEHVGRIDGCDHPRRLFRPHLVGSSTRYFDALNGESLMPALSAAVDELQAPRVYWTQGRRVEVDNEQIRRGPESTRRVVQATAK